MTSIPTFVAAGAGASITGTGALAVPLPASVLEHDLLWAVIEWGTTTAGHQPTLPSGWSFRGTRTIGAGSNLGGAVAYKWATPDDAALSAASGSVSFTCNSTDHSLIRMAAYRGGDFSRNPGLDSGGTDRVGNWDDGTAVSTKTVGAANGNCFDNNSLFIWSLVHDINTVTCTITDPNSQLSSEVRRFETSTTRGNTGAVELFDGGVATAPAANWSSSPASAAFDTADNMHALAVSLTPLPTAINRTATSGSLGHATGAAVAVVKNGLAVSGSLGHATGAMVGVVNDGIAVAGQLQNVTGAAVLGLGAASSISGTLGNVTGAAQAAAGSLVAIAGTLGGVTGDSVVTIGDYLRADGSLGQVTGAVDIAMGAALAVSGSLGNVTGDATITTGPALDIAGLLGSVFGESGIGVAPIEINIDGMLSQLVGRGRLRNAILHADELATAVVPQYDRVVILEGADRTAVFPAIDRAAVLPITDRTSEVVDAA